MTVHRSFDSESVRASESGSESESESESTSKSESESPTEPETDGSGESSSERRQGEKHPERTIAERLAETEQQLVQVQRTLVAVAQVADISIGGPCAYCERSRVLLIDGELRCPECGYQRSL